MKRKTFLPQVAIVSSSVFLAKDVLNFFNHDFPVVRVPRPQRKCTSQAVKKAITDFIFKVVNKELRWLFEKLFSQSLNIDAMWLLDSSAQVWSYLPLMKDARI